MFSLELIKALDAHDAPNMFSYLERLEAGRVDDVLESLLEDKSMYQGYLAEPAGVGKREAKKRQGWQQALENVNHAISLVEPFLLAKSAA